MSKKIIHTTVRKNEFGEWHVKAYVTNDKKKLARYPDGDYFTNDEKDARGTAKLMTKPC